MSIEIIQTFIKENLNKNCKSAIFDAIINDIEDEVVFDNDKLTR